MPILRLDDGTLLTDLDAISRELDSLCIDLKHFDPGTSLLFPDLASRDLVDDAERLYIVELHDAHLEFLRQDEDYLWSDLLVLHPGSPNLYTLAITYSRYHIHTTPEALYVLTGEAVYGFVQPEGRHLELLLQAQDYIRIPAGVEHWFSPAASLQLKAVRYFTAPEGWVPRYTGTQSYPFGEESR